MKVVIADSSELMRLGIRSLLKTELDVEIVGEAHDGDELLELIKNFEIDLVIIDYTSMGFSVDNVAKLRSVYPNLNVLAITPEQSAIVLVDALKAGVTSYVKRIVHFRKSLMLLNRPIKVIASFVDRYWKQFIWQI